MIPKVIHYLWFGKKPLPESVQRCIASWKHYCPDYEIIQWNEDNYNYAKNSYMLEAYNAGKYAFVSDYARLDIVNSNGGFYLDTDVELVKSLDELRRFTTYMGMELPGQVNTGLGFGSVKNSPVLKENMSLYEATHFVIDGHLNKRTCVEYTDEILTRRGLTSQDTIQNLVEITVFPTEFFCPMKMGTTNIKITAQTISIHRYEATWYSSNRYISAFNKRMLPIKLFAKRTVNSLLGDGTYDKIKFFLKR